MSPKEKPTFIDTHAHLTFPQFDPDRAQVLKRAWDAGVEYIVLVGAGEGVDGTRRAIQLAHTDRRFFCMVGIHPHDAEKMEPGWLKQIEEFAQDNKVVAIGEIGLDYHYEHATREAQRTLFTKLANLSVSLGKPVVIHDREAHDDVWRIVKSTGIPKGRGLFHCFSGDVAFAIRAVEAGFLISVPGIVTFRNARLLQEVVAAIPLEKMVIETDCPFLAPEPHRGSRNEPAFVPEVAKKIAEIKGLAPQDVARVTTLNAKRFFGLPGHELAPSIAYSIRNSLYLNITNRCNLTCSFCPKFGDFEVKGYLLRLTREPDVEEVFQAMGEPLGYDEVVFCGYGEPTVRLEVLKIIARRMKEAGAKRIRLNTDGLANLVHGRNILPELTGIIDAVSVSLNAADAATYAKNCRSKFGEDAYTHVCEFITQAKNYIPEVVATVVALPGLDIAACQRKTAELGVVLKVREYMNLG